MDRCLRQVFIDEVLDRPITSVSEVGTNISLGKIPRLHLCDQADSDGILVG